MATETQSSAISRDLRLNLRRILEEGSLAADEANLALLATATAVGHPVLASAARTQLEAAGLTPEQIQEAVESAAIMGMLNTYYKFRHMVGNDADYGPAKLRMMALSAPVMGKVRFEMLAFAVSVINSCEPCIRSHENVLRNAGVDINKLHDLARLASVVKGLSMLEH